MGENSKIEWTHHTFNPWRGCTKVSAGCAHCYAEKQAKRNPAVLGIWGDGGTRVVASEAMWREPLRWDREAREAGERRRVFCASMADVFEGRPELAPWRARLFELIRRTPDLDWLLLTKRPESILRLWPADANEPGASCWPNVWLGVSVEHQAAADERIPLLLQCPAAVRFLSCEPLLGPVDVARWLTDCYHLSWSGDEGPVAALGRMPQRWRCDGCGTIAHGSEPEAPMLRGIDWVIVGGESGPGARPMHPDWARSLRDQCQAAGVAFHFKQWSEFCPPVQLPPDAFVAWDASENAAGHPDLERPLRFGKKLAGRQLDGLAWDELPVPVIP